MVSPPPPSSLWMACHQPTGWTVINVDSSSNTMVTITTALQPQEPVSRQSSTGLGLVPIVTLQRFVSLYQNITSYTWRAVWESYPADRNMHNIFRSLKGFTFQISITCYICEQGWNIILFWWPYGTTTKCETKSILQNLCNSYQAFVLTEGNFWTFLTFIIINSRSDILNSDTVTT